MTLPDPASFALRIARLQRWLDAVDPHPTVRLHYIDRVWAAIKVDATSTEPAASLNRNAIRLFGGRGLSANDLNAMSALFEEAGAGRFFVWLHPGPDMEVVRRWLAANGAKQVPWTRYPTMVHTGRTSPQRTSTLTTRKITVEDVAKYGLAEHGENYVRTVGYPGFHHFAAFEGGQPIATAMLDVFEDMGYIAGAHTTERFRKRGAQTALIAARLEEAHRLGCKLIVTDTLTMLEHSYSNLLRAGFEVVYDRELRACNATSQPRYAFRPLTIE